MINGRIRGFQINYYAARVRRIGLRFNVSGDSKNSRHLNVILYLSITTDKIVAFKIHVNKRKFYKFLIQSI